MQKDILFQRTMQVRGHRDKAESLNQELEQARNERMNFLRHSFYQEKEQLRKLREERMSSDLQARRESFTREKNRQQTSSHRRQALRDIKEAISKQNYMLKIKRELDELAGYSVMLDDLAGVQKQAYECMKDSSMLSKRTESELRNAITRDQTFLTDR